MESDKDYSVRGGDLIECFKIFNGPEDDAVEKLFQLSKYQGQIFLPH